jgi:hypothetical protein
MGLDWGGKGQKLLRSKKLTIIEQLIGGVSARDVHGVYDIYALGCQFLSG